MVSPTPDEQFVAGVIADALTGRLRVSLSDAGRIALAAGRLRPEHLAPVVLRLWVGQDPRARDLIRRFLGAGR